VAGRAQFNVLQADKAFFYGGTSLGTKKVLSFGAAFDHQEDFNAYDGDVFFDHPIGPGAITTQLNYNRFDGGETLTTLAKQDDVLVEAATTSPVGEADPLAAVACAAISPMPIRRTRRARASARATTGRHTTPTSRPATRTSRRMASARSAVHHPVPDLLLLVMTRRGATSSRNVRWTSGHGTTCRASCWPAASARAWARQGACCRSAASRSSPASSSTLRPLCGEVIVVASTDQHLPALPVTVVLRRGRAPGAAGRHLLRPERRQRRYASFVTACDSAFLNPVLIAYLVSQLAHHDAVVPHWNGRLQPLHAVYRTSVVAVSRRATRSRRAADDDAVRARAGRGSWKSARI
jgi:hypothetical protein